MKIQKSIEIRDAEIQYVSLVDKAANKRKFLITKAENGKASFSVSGKIIKVDTNTHYITGVVYEPFVEDTQGNFMTEEEIRKAAYWFAKNGDKVDIQHSFKTADNINVVENYITPCDMKLGSELITKGTWVMTVEVKNPDIWDKVQKQEITGFSMGGMGNYIEEDVNLDDITKTDEDTNEKKSLFKKFAAFCGYDVVEKEETDKNVENANKNVKKEESALDEKKLQEMIDGSISKAIEPIMKAIEKAEEEDTSTSDEANVEQEQSNTINQEKLQNMIDSSIEKAVEPVLKALKARGVASNLNENGSIEKAEVHYLKGIL